MTVLNQRTALTNGEFVLNYYQAEGTDAAFFIAPFDLTVKYVQYVHGTAEGSASTVQVERLQGTEDVTEGDDLLATALDGNGTADTVQNGALTSTTANLTLSKGDRLAIYYSASTTVAEVALTIVVEKA
jgi:hypothetical protein